MLPSAKSICVGSRCRSRPTRWRSRRRGLTEFCFSEGGVFRTAAPEKQSNDRVSSGNASPLIVQGLTIGSSAATLPRLASRAFRPLTGLLGESQAFRFLSEPMVMKDRARACLVTGGPGAQSGHRNDPELFHEGPLRWYWLAPVVKQVGEFQTNTRSDWRIGTRAGILGQ